MTNPNDPKVVPGGDVQFDSGSAPQADTLDAVVQQVGGGSATGGSWITENIKYLADKTGGFLQRSSGAWITEARELGGLASYAFPPQVQGLLVQCINLQKPEKGHAKIGVSNFDPLTLRRFLEDEYHPDIASSGIYQATGLDQDHPVGIDRLDPFFPEIKNMVAILGRYVPCVENPYAALLMLPPRVRPLLTGALRELNPTVDNAKTRENFPQVITLKEILSYAAKVNETRNIAEYMKLLQEKPK